MKEKKVKNGSIFPYFNIYNIKSNGYIETYIFKKGGNQNQNEKAHLPSYRNNRRRNKMKKTLHFQMKTGQITMYSAPFGFY